ncbi:hypothetical protein OG923_33325 (plasmid) [Streptomyces halstedii]
MTSNFTKLPWPTSAPKNSPTADENAPAPPKPATGAEPAQGGPDAATSSG